MTKQEKIKRAIVDELKRQMEGIYWWDASDQNLFDDAEPLEAMEFEDGKGGIIHLNSRFDLDAVALAAMRAAG